MIVAMMVSIKATVPMRHMCVCVCVCVRPHLLWIIVVWECLWV